MRVRRKRVAVCGVQRADRDEGAGRWRLAGARLAARSAGAGALLVAALVGAVACDDDRARLWREPLAVQGPYRVDQQALWLEGSQGMVYALDPSADPPRVRHAGLGRHVRFVLPGSDGSDEALLVLTAGQRRERADQREEPPALHLISAPADRAPQVRTMPLATAFNRVVRSKDGRWALLHFGPETAGEQQSGSVSERSPALFRNPNEVAVVDLSAAPERLQPVSRPPLRSFGAAPLGALISPPLALPGRESPLVLGIVLARDLITLFDLEHRERREVSVRLAAATAETTTSPSSGATPEQVLFAPAQGQIFVRAAGVADLFILTLTARATTSAGAAASADNDFSVTINQPSAGAAVQDMLLLPQRAKTTLLLATSAPQLTLLEVETGALSALPLSAPVDALQPVPLEAPRQVVAFSRRERRNRVHIVDLERLVAERGGALTTRTLGDPLRDVVIAPSGRQAVLLYDSKRTPFSVLDLAGGHFTDTPIELSDTVGRLTFSGTTHLLTTSVARPRLGMLDLETLQGSELPIERPAEALLVLGDRVVLDHPCGEGLATVLPRPPLSAADGGRVVWGFFLDGLLDRRLRD